jgi:glycolate oxidase FAD binding subunit
MQVAGEVRDGRSDRSDVDGVVAREVVEPASAEEIAALLAASSRQRASVVIRGGGTKLGWGRTPATVDAILSTKRLNALVAHEHADLTATVQAGARLADVNRLLARHGQWLPIESAFEGSTIGGAIGTNDSGPLRHRYGTPRDLLIGVRLALTDGRLIKAGGNVVKNVAGYDIGRLICGSHGSLAAIVSATFKLSPLPAASETLVASFATAEALAAAVSALTSSQLEPAAVELRVGRAEAGPYGAAIELRGGRSYVAAGFSQAYHLLLKFESTKVALGTYLQRARALMEPAESQTVSSQSEMDLWREHIAAPWRSPGAVIRFAWLPASLGAVHAFVDGLRNTAGDVELIGRAAIGSGLLRLGADGRVQRDTIEHLRSHTDVFRHVVVLRAEPSLKEQLDVWGPLGDAGSLGASVKHALDPNGILNAGRGPV